MDRAVRELNFNLARAHMDAHQYREAMPLLEQLVTDHPDDGRFVQQLANCCVNLREMDRARRILTELAEKSKEGPWTHLLMGVVEYEDGNTDEALRHWIEAEKAEPRLPNLHLRLGNAHLRRRHWEDAERAYRKALEIDDDNPHAHLGLAMVALRQRRHQQAAEEALTAVGIQHFLPGGHYHLGVALVRLGHLDRAQPAFETALSMSPGLIPAHRFLAALHRHQDNIDKFAEHRTRAAELRKKKQA